MRTAMNRTAAALLAALLLLGLTGCEKKGEVHKVGWVTAPAYEAEGIALPVQTGDLLGGCTDGAYMYVLVGTKEEEEEKFHLLRASLADGEAVELDGYEDSAAPDDGGKNILGPVLAPDGTMWLYGMWSIAYYGLPEDFDPKKESKGQYCTSREEFHHLRRLDPATGRQKALIDLSDAVRTLDVSNAFDIAGFTVDGRGNIYFAGTGGVAVMTGKGKYLFTLEASLPRADFDGTSGGPLVLLPDGSAAALTRTYPNGFGWYDGLIQLFLLSPPDRGPISGIPPCPSTCTPGRACWRICSPTSTETRKSIWTRCSAMCWSAPPWTGSCTACSTVFHPDCRRQQEAVGGQGQLDSGGAAGQP